MSETPRTDEYLHRREENGHTVVVSIEFARQLEIELADKEKQLAEAWDEIERLKKNRKTKLEAKMIEVRKISSTQLDGVSLFLVFYNGTCKKVYARNEKEAEEKAAVILKETGQG